MAFDFNVIKEVYSKIVKKVDKAKNLINKPLTLSEKILYSPVEWPNYNSKID